MWNYKSPIELDWSPMKMVERLNEDLNEHVFSAVQECDIRVNKAHLEEALKYDRHQYEIGYSDGFADGIEAGRKDALATIKRYLKGELKNEEESGEEGPQARSEEESDLRG